MADDLYFHRLVSALGPKDLGAPPSSVMVVLVALVVVQPAENSGLSLLWQSMVPSSVPWNVTMTGAGPDGVFDFGAPLPPP